MTFTDFPAKVVKCPRLIFSTVVVDKSLKQQGHDDDELLLM
jgi:hypothetical protein